MRTSGLCALAIGLRLLIVPLRADGALAVGLPDGDPRNGFTYGLVVNKPADEAKDKALGDCRGVDVANTTRARAACKFIEAFKNECANIAWNGDAKTPSTAVGWGMGPDKKAADARAVAHCEGMRKGRGRECRPDGDAICDGIAKKSE